MAQEICTHLPISHERPTNAVQFYDNVTLTLCYVEALFEVISNAEEGRSSTSEVAYLGTHLCKDLRHRLRALYEFQERKIT